MLAPMKSVTKSPANDVRNVTSPVPGDWPSLFTLMTGLLVGLAGDRARLRVSGDLESVAAPNLLIPNKHLRLLTLFARLTDGAREIQDKLVASSMALRSELLLEMCGGPPRKKKGDDAPLQVRQQHIEALQVDMDDEQSESSALKNLYADVARGRQAQRENALHRPRMTLESPEAKMLTELVAGCHSGRGLVLGDLPATTRPTRARIMQLLQGTVCTMPAGLRRGLAGEHTAMLKMSTVLRADPEIIEGLFKNDLQFFSHFILLQPGDAGGLFLPAANGSRTPIPETLWLELFSGAVVRVIAARRSGLQIEGWFRDAGAAREFEVQRHNFLEELEAGDYGAMAFAELPTSIAWLFTQLHPERSCDQMILNLAVNCSRILWQRHCKLLSAIRERHKRTAEDQHEQKILQRVRECGTPTPREVIRGFDKQDYAIHRPAIDRLLASGKLVNYGNRLRLSSAAG